MAQKPRKSVIQNILKNLVDSEIPGIQAVVKELTDWTKQLEERSWKIQHYASEIEEATAEEETEAPEEASLADLVKNLEKTLSQLRQKPEDGAEETVPAKAKPAKVKPAAAMPVKPEPVEAAPQEAAPVETVPVKAEVTEEEPSEPDTEAVEEETAKPEPESTKNDGVRGSAIRETFGLRGLRQTVSSVEPPPRSEEEREEPKEEVETYITPEGFIVKRARK